MLVMARYKSDGVWYRAQILWIKDEKVFVKYLDFGNKSEIALNEIGAINERWLYEAPPIAARCALDLPADLNPASTKAVELFKKFAKDGDQSFNYELIRSEESHAVIKIYKEDKKDLLEDILPLCEPSIMIEEKAESQEKCDCTESVISSADSEYSICSFGVCLKLDEVDSRDDWSWSSKIYNN
jgi:hypothetical protein